MQYRYGLPDEAPQIAPLLWQASKLSHLLYTDLLPNTTGVEVLQKDVSLVVTNCSYANCLVGLAEDQVVAVVNFYPSNRYCLTDEMRRRFAPPKIHYISPLFQNPLPDSLYLAALAVSPAYQGKGIGNKLVQLIGPGAISLHCWVENTRAMSMYKALSFTMVEQWNLGPHPLIPYNGKIALLLRP